VQRWVIPKGNEMDYLLVLKMATNLGLLLDKKRAYQLGRKLGLWMEKMLDD
jgi:hypothetical protein